MSEGRVADLKAYEITWLGAKAVYFAETESGARFMAATDAHGFNDCMARYAYQEMICKRKPLMDMEARFGRKGRFVP